MHSEYLEKPRKDEEKRTVKFAPETVDNEREFTPYKKMRQQPNFSRMKKEVLRCLNVMEHDRLESYLNSYGSQEVVNFYKAEGSVLFGWALINAPSAEPLAFLVKHVPKTIIRDLLMDHNFVILGSFLYAQKNREKRGYSDVDKTKLAMDKIEILLGIDDPQINTFIYLNITDSVKRILGDRVRIN
ncbi:MAG: hypothetical protein KBD23_00610 [Gammaproteobacteria bacterium]|nr:hypothetical protein [Gammaproteobacteria bacterium]